MAQKQEYHKIALSLEKQFKNFEPTSKISSLSSIDAFNLLVEYDNAVGSYFKIKAKQKNSADFKKFHEIIVTCSFEILKFRAVKDSSNGYKEWILEYRSIWKKNIELFFFCLTLFVVSLVIGWSIGVSQPSFVSLIVPQNMMEMIIDHSSWFEKLQENPLLGGLSIAVNNIRVSTVCFLMGALLGFGGMILLCYNGLLFGTMFGYCMVRGFHKELLDFVLSHGFLELTIIIASAFSGLLIGRIFYLRPYKNFSKRFRVAAKEAGIVVTGILPWLILAAFFEGFVSPFHYLPSVLKLWVGISIGLFFVYWTFRPNKAVKKEIEVRKIL